MILYRISSLIQLSDIALMPAHRNTGLGGTLIRRLQKEAGATGKRMRLNVMKAGPAVRFYRRNSLCSSQKRKHRPGCGHKTARLQNWIRLRMVTGV